MDRFNGGRLEYEENEMVKGDADIHQTSLIFEFPPKDAHCHFITVHNISYFVVQGSPVLSLSFFVAGEDSARQ